MTSEEELEKKAADSLSRVKIILFSLVATGKLSWCDHVPFYGKVTDFDRLEQVHWRGSKNLSLWLLSRCYDEAISLGNIGAETPFYMAMSRLQILVTYLTMKEQDQLVAYLLEKES